MTDHCLVKFEFERHVRQGRHHSTVRPKELDVDRPAVDDQCAAANLLAAEALVEALADRLADRRAVQRVPSWTPLSRDPIQAEDPESRHAIRTDVAGRPGARQVAWASALTHAARIRMITCVRTTLVLDDQLLRQARRRAAERNASLSAVVNDALREAFREQAAPSQAFKLITFAGAGGRVRHEAEDFKGLLEEEDTDRLR